MLLLLSSHIFVIEAQESYDARIGTKEILTPIPNTSPVINGPKIYGARPGKKFVYRIPCQGQRPISFKVIELPKGMTLDADNGIISGVTPATKGDYVMTFNAENSHGNDSRLYKLVVGDKLALTPPTGWNTWGGHMIIVSDKLMRKAADIFIEKGLADVGFQYLSIDDCWMRVSQESYDAFDENKRKKYEGFDFSKVVGKVRDAKGEILPNSKFPDMKAMTDYIHSKGLKVGIYSSPGPYTCQQFAGSYMHEKQDAETYAKWGFDLLKYDMCSASILWKKKLEENPDYKQSELWKPMAGFMKEQDRDILLNLCQYGKEEPWKWAPGFGISTWRTGTDLNHKVETYFDRAIWQATELRAYSKAGQWNDPDFLYIHKIRNHGKMSDPTHEIDLNTNQRYQYVTLWSIINAPFFFSCNIEEMDDFTVGLLTNADVLNINQDELGHVGEVIRNKNNEVVIVKNLANGSKAVAVFNNNADKEDVIRVDWDDLGLCCEQLVYDVWRQKEIGFQKGGMSFRLSPNGVGYYILSDK